MAIKSGMISGSLVVEEKSLNLMLEVDDTQNYYNLNSYILLVVGIVVMFYLFAIYKQI